eukprot:scaffold18.g1888.t1
MAAFAQYTGLRPQAASTCTFQPRTSPPRRCLVIEAKVPTQQEQRERRHLRVRRKVEGTPERPRLAVFRSNSHIYAQASPKVIDDTAGHTLAAASTLTPEIRAALADGSSANVEAARLVGAKIAELCKAAAVDRVAFDRGGFRYHGRVEALAEAAREAGLSF